MPIVNCANCEKKFHKKPSQLKENNFCCYPCSNEFKIKNRPKVKCDCCGKEFYKASAQIKATKSNFCSKACCNKVIGEKIRNEIKFDINENGCHICTSHCKDKDGYLKIYANGKHLRLHRYIYEQNFGEIPKGLVIRHKCDNPTCINPEHLEKGTVQDNNIDKVIRNRMNPKSYEGLKIGHKLTGVQKNRAKLSEKDVKEIRISDLKTAELVEIYKVTRKTIENAKRLISYKHI